MRNDLHGIDRAPKYIEDFLVRIGGRNVYGEPMFRLVLAQNRFVLAAGEWNEWPEGADVNDRGGLGISKLFQMQQEGKSNEEIREALKANISAKPIKVVRGMVESEKYACEGWVLEKWLPAKCYGSEAEWYSYKFEDKPALGPYPAKGDYEMIAGPTEKLPSLSVLESVVRQHFAQLEARNPNPMQRQLERVNQLDEAREKRRRDNLAKIDARVKEIDPLRKTLSLGAQRVVNEWAEGAGIRSHCAV